jgi:hypothetical protein
MVMEPERPASVVLRARCADPEGQRRVDSDPNVPQASNFAFGRIVRPTGVVSGRTGVRAKAVLPIPFGKRLAFRHPQRIASETLMLEQSTVSEPGLWLRG